MDIEFVIKVLIGSQAGLLAMLVAHLFKCRDTRVDIAVIRQMLADLEKRLRD